MDLNDLSRLQNISFEEINKHEITDISEININTEKSKVDRIKKYLENSKNPYFIKCGDIFIKMSFSSNGILIDECIERYLIECVKNRL